MSHFIDTAPDLSPQPVILGSEESTPVVKYVTYADRTECWTNNKLGSLDMPAVVYGNGRLEWWWNGKRHRFDAPAIITETGDEEWFLFGYRHRSDDLPAVVRKSGLQEWWQSGHRHRANGPAVSAPGLAVWYRYGQEIVPK